MRLRDRLDQLSSPAGRGARALRERIDGSDVDERPPEAPLLDPLDAGIDPFFDPDDRAARIAQLRDLIGRVATRERLPPSRMRRPHGPPQGLHLGALRENAYGALRIVERWLEPHHCHGRVRVRDALCVQSAHAAALAHDRTLAELPLGKLLILDTETTGLAGGTGTVPFLIGLGWFDGEGEHAVLKVEQLFLDDLGREAPLLHHLAERLAAASVLVTYNGKAFDWPLLRARFVLSRIAVPALPPHLDLLHCARRLWSKRLPNVRLTEVERSVLGMWRHDDVDGAMIPGLYHDYLRGGDPRALEPVLEHNAHDVIALAALLARLGRLYGDGDASHAPDLLACALVALRARDAQRALRFAERAAEEAEDDALRVRALLLHGRMLARAGERALAIARYQRALDHRAGEAVAAAAHLALARLHERARDLGAAHAHARNTEPAEGPVAHARRLGRLRRRMLDAPA